MEEIEKLKSELKEAYEVIRFYAECKNITGSCVGKIEKGSTYICIGDKIGSKDPIISIEMGTTAKKFLISKGQMKEPTIEPAVIKDRS